MHQFTDLKLTNLRTSRKQFIWISIFFLVVVGYVMWDDPGCSNCYLKTVVVFIFFYGLWFWDHLEARTLASSVSGFGDQWQIVYGTGRERSLSRSEIKYIQVIQTSKEKYDEVTLVGEDKETIRLSSDMENLRELVDFLDPTYQLRSLGYKESTKRAYWWVGSMLLIHVLGTAFIFYTQGWSFSFYVMLVIGPIWLPVIWYINYLSKIPPEFQRPTE